MLRIYEEPEEDVIRLADVTGDDPDVDRCVFVQLPDPQTPGDYIVTQRDDFRSQTDEVL